LLFESAGVNMLEPAQIPHLHDFLLAGDWVSSAHLLQASAASSGPSTLLSAANEGYTTFSPPPSPSSATPTGRQALGGVVGLTKTYLPTFFGSAVDLTASIAKSLTPGFVLEGAGQAVVKAGQLGFLPNLLLDEKMRAERTVDGSEDAVNPLRDPPLCWVARKNQPQLVDLLVIERASLECRHEGGATPLYLASQEGHVEVVRRLLKHGARVDSADADGWLPLHAAAHNGHLACVDLLLEAHRLKRIGLDMASSNTGTEPKGATALHLACRENHLDVVKALLRADAHPKARTRGNATPLHFAAGFGSPDIVSALLAKVSSSSGPVPRTQQTALTTYIDSIDAAGSTALHYLARHKPRNALRIAEILLANGADPTLVNSANRTPLRQAILSNAGDLVALFLDSDRLPFLSLDSPVSVRGKEAVEQMLLKAARGTDRSASAAQVNRVQLDAVWAVLGYVSQLEVRCKEAEARYERLVSGRFFDDELPVAVEEVVKDVTGGIVVDDPWRKVLRKEESSVSVAGSVSRSDTGRATANGHSGFPEHEALPLFDQRIRTPAISEDLTFSPEQPSPSASEGILSSGIRRPKPLFDEPEFQTHWS